MPRDGPSGGVVALQLMFFTVAATVGLDLLTDTLEAAPAEAGARTVMLDVARTMEAMLPLLVAVVIFGAVGRALIGFGPDTGRRAADPEPTVEERIERAREEYLGGELNTQEYEERMHEILQDDDAVRELDELLDEQEGRLEERLGNTDEEGVAAEDLQEQYNRGFGL